MALLLLLFVLTGACSGTMGNSAGDTSPDGAPLDGLQSLAISPESTTVTVSKGKPQTVAYTVTGTFPSGTRDVTDLVSLSVEDGRLATFDGASLKTTDSLGGKTKVIATSGSITVKASLTVKLQLRSTAPGAPPNAQGLFDQTTAGTGTGPVVLYPPTGALVPPNLGEMDVMWTDSTHDLWELSVQSDTTDIKIYTDKLSQGITSTTWQVMADSNLDGKVTLTVRGLLRASPGSSVGSGDVELRFGHESVQGGLYYWAAVSDGGVIRYDFGKANQQAESYYTKADANDCVACHALSPDGTRMAVTFSGGDGAAGILDVAKRSLTADKTYHANFQVFTPDNKYLITSSEGVLSVRDPTTGAEQAQLSTGGKATMPDVSPDGKQLVFVRPSSYTTDWTFTGGSIVGASLSGTTIGAPQVLVQGSATENNYYPAFSPDSKWIIFNRSSGDSYSDDDASLWVVSASGGGTPIELSNANQGKDLRNSWARWSPFVQSYLGGDLVNDFQTGKLFWFTFSSTRDYGTALSNGAKDSKDRNPQLWMAAFHPELAQAGKDPSTPAFWLPFQQLTTNNHIAQWTKKVVKLE